MPNTFLYKHTAVWSRGYSQGTRNAFDVECFQAESYQGDCISKAQFAAKHFGASGFIPVPKFKLLFHRTQSDSSICAWCSFQNTGSRRRKEILLPVLLSIVNPSAETEQKTIQHFKHRSSVSILGCWSSKALPITEEIVEDLLQSGKMPLPLGKKTLNAKIVTATSKQMLQMFK